MLFTVARDTSFSSSSLSSSSVQFCCFCWYFLRRFSAALCLAVFFVAPRPTLEVPKAVHDMMNRVAGSAIFPVGVSVRSLNIGFSRGIWKYFCNLVIWGNSCRKISHLFSASLLENRDWSFRRHFQLLTWQLLARSCLRTSTLRPEWFYS